MGINLDKIYRAVSKSVAAELFKNTSEKCEHMNNWIKIFGYNEISQGKGLNLFSVTYVCEKK